MQELSKEEALETRNQELVLVWEWEGNLKSDSIKFRGSDSFVHYDHIQDVWCDEQEFIEIFDDIMRTGTLQFFTI